MKISIITATYNSKKNILSALDSIIHQTHTNIEWIIVDGASQDNTIQLIQDNLGEFSTKTTIISEPDTGIYNALNKGIKAATGDVIGFLHSDDFIQNNQVISSIAASFSNPNLDGIYGDLNYVSAENHEKIIRKWTGKPFRQSRLKWGWMPAHPTLFLKKEIYQQHGKFDETFRIAADYDFMLRILKDSKLTFLYLPIVFTNMRLGGVSSASSNIKSKMKEDLRAMRNNQIRFPYVTLIFKNIRKLGQFF